MVSAGEGDAESRVADSMPAGAGVHRPVAGKMREHGECERNNRACQVEISDLKGRSEMPALVKYRVLGKFYQQNLRCWGAVGLCLWLSLEVTN